MSQKKKSPGRSPKGESLEKASGGNENAVKDYASIVRNPSHLPNSLWIISCL